MKTILLKHWNLMRVLRLAIGAWALINAYQNKIPLLGLMGSILMVMAVLNVGCWGVNSCSTKVSTNKSISEKPGEKTMREQ